MTEDTGDSCREVLVELQRRLTSGHRRNGYPWAVLITHPSGWQLAGDRTEVTLYYGISVIVPHWFRYRLGPHGCLWGA